MVVQGAVDGALVGEASLSEAWQEGLPIVAVARMGHADSDKPGMIMVSPKGRGYTNPEDLRGTVVASRRAGAGDETLFREYFSQAKMTPNVDFKLQSQTNDIHLKKGLTKGSIDASLYHVYGALRHIARGDWEQIQPMDWVPPEMPAAYLVFHRDFVKNRSDDIQRILTGLAWRVHYEKGLSTEEFNVVRDFGYVLNFEYDNLRLPHTTYPFDIIPEHLSDMQTLLIKHGFFDSPIDVHEGLMDDSFHNTLEQLRNEEGLLPPNTIDISKEMDAIFTQNGLIDMAVGIDGHTNVGWIQRKLEENNISTGLSLPTCSIIDTLEYCSDSKPYLFQQNEHIRYPMNDIRKDPMRRLWAGPTTLSHSDKNPKISRIRYDGDSVEEMTQLIKEQSSPVLWLNPIFSSPELIEKVLSGFPNVYISLGTLDPELDLSPIQRTAVQSQPFDILVDRIELPKGGWIAKVEPKWEYQVSERWLQRVQQYPNRFVFGSDLGISIHYETRYYHIVQAFQQFVARLPSEQQQMVKRDNALKLLQGTLP